MRNLIKNASIFDEKGKCSKVNILIDGASILKVSETDIDIPAIEYDLSGYTIMPGFINTHVHLIDCFDSFNEDKLKKWLMSGFTYLRDQGILSRNTTKEAVEWRNKLKSSCLYPSIAVCGKFISAINGYGGVEPFGVSNEYEAREAVKMQIASGVDHIKITLDNGYDAYTQSLDALPFEILFAICDETHKHGKKVSAHVNSSDKLDILLKAGIDEAAHACYNPISEDNLKYMVRNNIFMTPTLSVYGEILTNWGAPLLYKAMENTKRFVDMGGIIGLGNDYINEKEIWSPVGMPIMEIELLQKAGLTMYQIISAATSGGAKIIGNNRYGAIKEGCVADLIAVKGNPYEFPYLLSNVNFVMKDGIVVKQ